MIYGTTARALSADPDLRPLLRQHWEEVAKNKHLMVLDWDEARYFAVEDAGNLLVLIARDEDKRLVGYSINVMAPHLHYQQLRVCMNDVLFVAPHARGPVGVRLIRATEKAAAKAGCRMVGWHAKEGTSLNAMLPRLDYGVQDIIYTKELKWDSGDTQPPRC